LSEDDIKFIDENIQEAKNDYDELDEDDDIEDFTTVLKDDSGIVVVQIF
jgi:hypothetical protein